MGINESFFQLTFFINKRVSTERIEKIVNNLYNRNNYTMDTKNRLKKLLKSEHFRKKTYNCTDFGTIIKQIFVPIPVLPKKERGIDSCDKRRNFNGTRCHKAR